MLIGKDYIRISGTGSRQSFQQLQYAHVCACVSVPLYVQAWCPSLPSSNHPLSYNPATSRFEPFFWARP